MSLGLAIKAARKKAGKTQTDVATAVDRTQVYVSFIETDRRTPSEALLDQIAAALDTTSADIRRAAKKAARGPAAKARTDRQLEAVALGAAIAAARERAKRSPSEVADALGIARNYQFQIEAGRSTPSTGLLDRLAVEIGTTAKKIAAEAKRIRGAREAA